MKQFWRGSTVDFSTQFLNSDGDVIAVDSATITISYPEDGFPLYGKIISATTAMTEGADDTWTATWDSSVSGPGYVWWHMRAESTDAAGEDGQFLLSANPANMAFEE